MFASDESAGAPAKNIILRCVDCVFTSVKFEQEGCKAPKIKRAIAMLLADRALAHLTILLLVGAPVSASDAKRNMGIPSTESACAQKPYVFPNKRT